ncbi:ATP-binding cassette domain-containing protein [Paenibacillus sp. MZ04-78.2]|uniref:ATP-binding cassette domain-containing protein n=1 Tax=Paenibacillus sp. MZ04-78.2 TaxID=2962034 RepID=UPI002815EAC6|nr:ATP-binding cassette domain-containing protein [Paenibacillus sp. MZ04-78.2]
MAAELPVRSCRTAAHLQVDDACYQYEPGSRREIDHVSLDLPQGKKIAVIGRSGAGKSTLLKLIQGALVPTEGQVTVNGMPAHSLGDGISGVISVLNQSPQPVRYFGDEQYSAREARSLGRGHPPGRQARQAGRPDRIAAGRLSDAHA